MIRSARRARSTRQTRRVDCPWTPTRRRNATSRNVTPNVDPGCIDLTATADESFVDLTGSTGGGSTRSSPEPVVISEGGANDNSVVIIETPDVSPSRGQRERRYRNRIQNRVNIDVDDDDDDDDVILPSIPFPMTPMTARVSTSNTTVESPEPEPIVISCPVCFDSDKTIKKTKRKLTSTVCGHVFCDTCIKSAVRAQKSCPVCRKKLILSQLHVIHI